MIGSPVGDRVHQLLDPRINPVQLGPRREQLGILYGKEAIGLLNEFLGES